MFNLYVICGMSGSGKTSIMDLLETDYGLKYPRSWTNRPARKNERNHTFASPEVFEMIKNTEKLAAYTVFDNYEYFTRFNQLDDSNMCVLDIEGIKSLKENYKNKTIKVIYIDSDERTRKQRMIERDGAIKAVNRIENDRTAFLGHEQLKDFTVTNNYNDDLKSVAKQIYDYILREEENAKL